MIDKNGNNLVFLLSTPRAGSTLLGAMLGRHSNVLCPSEPWFLLSLFSLYHTQNVVLSRYDQLMADIALKELVSEEEFRQAASDFAMRIYNSKLQMAQRVIFVDKTPRYYHILPFIDHLFPAAKKVWLKRNPLDVAVSYLCTWGIQVDELVGHRLSAFSFDVTLSLSYFAQFFRDQPNTYELTYEDLVRTPDKSLSDLCAFLGIPYQAGLENYGADASVIDSLKQRTLGDKNLVAYSKPHIESLGRWRHLMPHSDVQKLVDCIGSRFFDRMGYSETIKLLLSRGFAFPDESRVDDNLRALDAHARSLTYANRELNALKTSLDAALDELRTTQAELRVSQQKLRERGWMRHKWIKAARSLKILKLPRL